jgi:hypothetical protein
MLEFERSPEEMCGVEGERRMSLVGCDSYQQGAVRRRQRFVYTAGVLL